VTTIVALTTASALVGPARVRAFLYGVGEDVSTDCEVTT
jgi:hypothetical protein